MTQVDTNLARELIAAARRDGRIALDEPSAKRVLAAYGIAVPQSIRLDRAADPTPLLAAFSPPYVLKIVSRDVLHKSDVGGVRLGLRTATDVSEAMAAMAASAEAAGFRLDGFLLEETAPRGHDLVIGGFKDPSFGQMVMIGLGGVFVELLADVAFRICPITPIDASEMIADLRGSPVLAGARGGAAVPQSLLVDLLMAVGGQDGLLVTLDNDLAEVDLNPIIASPTGAVAVDARLVLTSMSPNG
jgi:acetate---CoA ligase (ADP-forming) subunit beta